jgi:hypothetical protein
MSPTSAERRGAGAGDRARPARRAMSPRAAGLAALVLGLLVAPLTPQAAQSARTARVGVLVSGRPTKFERVIY